MIDVRPLASVEEAAETVVLQRQIWGFEEVELVPKRLFVLAPKIGGHALGAFDGGRLVGFAYAIPGLKPTGKSYLHSHMVGVAESHRDRGVGRALKLAQRDEALGRGIDLIEWTFDPLQLKNAFFNIQRLGAIVRRFIPNQYGITTSHLQAGLPTDRCVAEWWLKSDRVQQALAGQAPAEPASPDHVITVPVSIATMRHQDLDAARMVQTRVREEFLEAFRQQLTLVGFRRDPECGAYLLSKEGPA